MTAYEKIFAANVRKLRKRAAMTQKMLADAVGYSEKTVSKWETDGCIPPVETLFRIAGVFRTDLNTLFAGDDAVCFLGIDGGGTKTAFALADHEGNVLRRLRLDPCNPFDVGIERAKAVLEDGIRQICAGMPLSSVAVFAGLAGCKSGEFADGIDAFLQQFGFAMAALDSDNENIIAAGLAGRDGITVILGTGICSFAVQGMRHDRIAGWGYLFDEGGSAYNIGRDALSQYYSSCDGSGEASGLTRRIREVTGCPETELLSRLYEGGKKRIASYASLVFEEAEKGDAAACAILRRNMGEAARIIRAALARFPETARDIPVVLAGGMTEQPLLLSYLREALGEECRGRLELLRVPPVDGALMKARTLWQEECRHE